MIVLFGPAGSGKTTQGRLLAERYGWKWLSVGQVLRDSGRFAETLKEGKLVDDMEVIRLMNHEIEKADAEGMDVILDGYPRDITQAKWMVENNFFDDVKMAIVLEVPKEELWKRIEGRGRNDDTKNVIERRFEVFEQNICSILPLMEAQNVIIKRVDGVGEFEEVTERLATALEDELGDLAEQEEDLTSGGEQSYGE
ncbi:nucleoside monophosphate kinase [Candidatus Saccharibacteria bacterium]|nr:nucleoside monophosphate kinase [Candidatus Saccharibacteria bacterium]